MENQVVKVKLGAYGPRAYRVAEYAARILIDTCADKKRRPWLGDRFEPHMEPDGQAAVVVTMAFGASADRLKMLIAGVLAGAAATCGEKVSVGKEGREYEIFKEELEFVSYAMFNGELHTAGVEERLGHEAVAEYSSAMDPVAVELFQACADLYYDLRAEYIKRRRKSDAAYNDREAGMRKDLSDRLKELHVEKAEAARAERARFVESLKSAMDAHGVKPDMFSAAVGEPYDKEIAELGAVGESGEKKE